MRTLILWLQPWFPYYINAWSPDYVNKIIFLQQDDQRLSSTQYPTPELYNMLYNELK